MIFRSQTSIFALSLSMLAGLPAFAQTGVPQTGQDTESDARLSGEDEAVQNDGDPESTPADEQSILRSAQERRNAIAGRPIENTDGNEIIVTGSRIARPNLSSASPITTITATDIAQSGAINIEDVLNRTPQFFPSAENFNEESQSGRQRLNLRRLGFNRTLVLINGLRSNQAEGVDVNSIPPMLLSRVDVLTGGASSVYGSDAVGGVVNFVLRDDLEGLEIRGDYSLYQHNNRDTIVSGPAGALGYGVPSGNTVDGGRTSLSLAGGINLFDKRLNLTGYVNYRHADPLKFKDRDYTACELGRGITDETNLTCAKYLSAYGPNGLFILEDGRIVTNAPDGSKTFVSPYVNARDFYNNTRDRYFQRPYERWNAGAFATFEVTDRIDLSATYMYGRDESESSYGGPIIPTSANYADYIPFLINCDNPLLSAQQQATICGSAAGTGETREIDPLYRFPDLSNLFGDFIKTQSHRGSLQLKGQLTKGWNFELGAVYSTLTTNRSPSPLPDNQRVARSLLVVNQNGVPTCQSVIDGSDPDCVPLDLFRRGADSAGLAAYLFTPDSLLSNAQTSDMVQVLANVVADLTRYGVTSPWAQDGIAVAAGLEFRDEGQVNSADPGFYDNFGGSDYDYRQKVYEANGEIQIPIVQDSVIDLLQLNGGYRISKYSTLSKATSTWKIETVFAPIEDIMFRGAINRALRAPSVYEGNPEVRFDPTGAGTDDFCAPQTDPDTGEILAPRGSLEACVASGLNPALYASPTLNCPANACVARIGGFDLRPEDARTYTVGVVLQPRFVPNFSLSVDYFKIRINDKIAFNYGDFALDSCRIAQEFCERIIRNPDGTLYGSVDDPETGFVIAGTTNEVREESRGLDVQANYGKDLGENAGSVAFSFNGSRLFFSGGQDSPVTLNKNCLGLFGPRCAAPIPKWTHNTRLTYTLPGDAISASFAWRYIGPTNSTRNSEDPAIGFGPEDRTVFGHIPGYSFFDASLSFSAGKNMGFGLVVNNLFDKMPPIIPDSREEFSRLSRSNTTPERYDPLGRQIFVRANVNF